MDISLFNPFSLISLQHRDSFSEACHLFGGKCNETGKTAGLYSRINAPLFTTTYAVLRRVISYSILCISQPNVRDRNPNEPSEHHATYACAVTLFLTFPSSPLKYSARILSATSVSFFFISHINVLFQINFRRHNI